MRELKHIGRIKSTNKKCLVAYRTLPGDAYNCLIIPTENLPDAYHDALINLVENNTGQTAYEFAEALSRTNFPDGSIMLSALHAQGRLVKIGTNQIEMTPQPATSILLSELNQIISEQRGIAVDELALQPLNGNDTNVIPQPEVIKEDLTTLMSLTPEEQATKLRADVFRLEQELIKMREVADLLFPIPEAPAQETVSDTVVKKTTTQTVGKKAKV